jgi:hypothetical protein
MMFGETLAVYCENYTEHINALCEQRGRYSDVKSSAVRSTHYVLKT